MLAPYSDQHLWDRSTRTVKSPEGCLQIVENIYYSLPLSSLGYQLIAFNSLGKLPSIFIRW